MNTELLIKQFEYTHYGVQANLQNISHEDSLIQPKPAGNCLNWVLGHIVYYRRDLLRLLEKPAAWSKEKYSRYGTGLKPLKDGSEALPLETIIQDFNSTQETLIDGLKQISSERLQSKIEKETVGEMLAGLQFHESYHVGQLGLLRRIAGRKGAMNS